MPRRKSGQPPQYRHHKVRDLAKVCVDRRDIYLGKYNSPESWQKYADVLKYLQQGLSGDQIAKALNGANVEPVTEAEAAPQGSVFTVGMLALRFFEHAKVYYAPREGGSGGRIANVKVALRETNDLFAGLPVEQFGPLKLITVRDAMIARGLERNYINDLMSIIVLMFTWGAEREIVPAEILVSLKAVRALRRGKTNAKEREEVKPVPPDDYQATVPFLPPTVRDMVKLHLLTGARPAEIRLMKPEYINRSEEVWCYLLREHKTDRFDKERRICIGPEAQQVLTPYLERPVDEYCFTTGRQPNKPYTKDAYCRAITRACKRAGVERWTPRQLRHSRATLIRKLYGLEKTRAVLGHSSVKTSEIYAEKDFETAAGIMEQIG